MNHLDTDLTTLPPDIEALVLEVDADPRTGPLIAWRALTDPNFVPCHEGCMAPGSSPHGHSRVIGYQLISERGILEIDTDGMGVRDSMLHPIPRRGTWYINVYEHWRHYGGPEEGGWHYDAGGLVDTNRVVNVTEKEARDLARAEQIDRNDRADEADVPDVGSVRYRGGRYIVRAEQEPGADWPAEIPHYE